MKYKKNFWLIIMSMFVGLSPTFTACGGGDSEPVPAMTVNGMVSIESNGTVSGEITVTTENTDWSVDVSNGREWLTAYKNGNKVALSAKENQAIEDRTGTIVVTATENTSLSYTVNVVQKGASPMITVNGAETTDITFTGVFDNKSGIDFKQTVKVVSNVNWSISGKPEWLNISPSNGSGNVDMVIYPAGENTKSSSRSVTITLNGGGKSATVNITQDAGKPVCYVDIANEVALYDRICWEYTATNNVNTFQWILISETEYNRLTDNEIEREVSKQEKLKFNDEYISFVAKDYNNNKIYPNTTYYIITLASDESDKYGELRKTKLTTPTYKNATDDAWVSFDTSKIYANISKGFWFDTKKEGYCNTYHLIYGIIPASNNYNSAVYAFEINYYLKYKKKHWYAENWSMEIVTDYPNDHTFTYNTSYLSIYPRCFAYAWGTFKDGTLSSDLTGFQWDTSQRASNQAVSMNSAPNQTENVLIRRSVEAKYAREMHQ